ncbi:non-ribosomal peptide synthetase [Rhizodiscina lignyota]|uniref:Non-ribosomal peptide synthetase n=1 Tax=Rhizodiscina lignyota TaxID=1504668 RepID=A0A9P4I0R3_9PEZI|nr:non-ribosomal peptide synthetase [Rhizodiscina lignyota]
MTAKAINLCELFAQAVQRHPNNLAIDHEEGCLTYRELDESSTALASALTKHGCGNSSPVLLVTAHGSLNIIAVLAILKSGSCFVPVDRRSWSLETIKYVCDTIHSSVIVNTTADLFEAPHELCRVLHIPTVPLASPVDARNTLTFRRIEPEDIACTIFTSGSTGKPKGVMISHKSLCLYANTRPLNLNIGPGDRLLHMLSVAFDACACMLFSTLGNCGTIVPAEPEDVYQKGPTCTLMAMTPSLLSNLPAPTSDDSICSNMRTIVLGGETPTADLLESWVDAGVQVLSAYGTSETTSMGSIHNVQRSPDTGKINPFLIGGFMEQSPIYLLHGDSTEVDGDGIDGEMVVAGDGVARGYYKDDARTNNSFVSWNGLRVYKTGDYARWVRGPADDRVLEFRGRKDRMVKNRGFSVNLDRDVEESLYAAGASFGVKSVHATITRNGIVAVVTPSCVDTTALLAKVEQTMCAYCIPYRIEAVSNFPLSPNGKAQSRTVLELIAAIDDARDSHDTTNGAESSSLEAPTMSRTGAQEDLTKVLHAAAEVLGCPDGRPRKIRGEDTFIAMGGSSLLALKFVSVLRKLHLHVSTRDVLKCRTFAEIARHASSISPFEPRTPRTIRDASTAQQLVRLRREACNRLDLADNSFDIAPLTSLQLELAMPTVIDESTNINQVKLAYGGEYAGISEKAWRAVWHSEPIFRTEISLAFGRGAHIVHRKAFRKPNMEVYSHRSDYDAAVKTAKMSIGLSCRLDIFALRQADAPTEPGFGNVSDKTNELTVVLTVHHSLMDGSSLKLLLDRVERAAQGRSLSCSPCSIDANLGLIATQEARDAEARAFFTNYLRIIPVENNSTRRCRISTQIKHVVNRTKTTLFEPSVSIHEVTTFAGERCVSAACIYYTAWAMAISALERTCTVVIGAVFSNRATQPGYEETIGPYIAALPLVFSFTADETVKDRLQRTMDDLVTLGEFAWVRSDQIGIGRRMGNILSMQLPLPDETSALPPIQVECVENNDFPMSMLVEANGDLRLLHDDTQFDNPTVQRLGSHFKHALYSLLHETNMRDCMRINQLHETALTQIEQMRVESVEETLKNALEQAVDRFFNLTALEDCSGTSLTYGELDRLSNITAHRINSDLPGAESIAIFGDGTVRWAIGLLGILKAGRIFVPLDPKWSADRRAAVCKESRATALILPNSTQEPEAAIAGMDILSVDIVLGEEHAPRNPPRLPDSASPDSDFVIVFTSGSTGIPKGIPLTHRGVLALRSSPEATMFAVPGKRIAQFMSPAFDYCNLEIFFTLLYGATLVLRDPFDPYAHLRKVNLAAITPSVLSVLEPDEYPNLEIIYSTGEPITNALVNKFATRTLLYNVYGPAECSVTTSYTRMLPGDTVTIGTPVPTARMYVLDEDQRPVRDGARGELYVAGIQVMRGYIASPEKTEQCILPDPWHEEERMYRTGDFASRKRDGRISYLGRVNRQVKIRGFRVELAQVEQTIVSGPVDQGITQCTALAIKGVLVAFIICEITDSEDVVARLRTRLRETLDSASVPQNIVRLEQFPRNPNGKVDVGALEAVYAKHLSAGKTYLPDAMHNSLESKLTQEWRQILQLAPDGQLQDSDDFFALGGHSVLVFLLARRLSVAFDVNVTVRELLPAPTFRGQIDVIKQLLQAKVSISCHAEMVSSQSGLSGRHENALSLEDLTEPEQQVWFQYQVATATTAFNVAKVLHISGAIDVVKLVACLNTALASDPVFRTNVVEGPNGPRRTLSKCAPKVREVVQLDIDAELNHPFDLVNDHLIRIHLIWNSDEKGSESERFIARIVIVTSHLITDLGTLQNLLQLTSLAYLGTTLQIHASPRHLDSKRWKRRSSQVERGFWKDYLSGHGYHDRKSSLLRPSFLTSPMATFDGASRTREFDGRLVTKLNNRIRQLGITHHQMGLAAAALLLQWLSGEDDIVLGAPDAGRSLESDREALGQFLDRLPIRLRLPGSASQDNVTTSTILTEVHDSALLALANAIPFSHILEALEFPNGLLYHALFECVVTFHPRGAGLDNWLQLPDCNVSETSLFARGSKFPLMLEWFEVASDQWMLHIEYDTSLLPLSTVEAIENALEIILSAIADDSPLSDLRASLDDPKFPDLRVRKDSLRPSPRSSLTSSGLSAEELITTIQKEMGACLNLSCTAVSPDTSFFSAGADSSTAVALRHRLRKLGFDIPLRAIFTAQSPLGISQYVLLHIKWDRSLQLE